jgi:hypothetical protein
VFHLPAPPRIIPPLPPPPPLFVGGLNILIDTNGFLEIAPMAFGGVPPYTYTVGWGDGSQPTTALSHQYTIPNVYQLTITATDSTGTQASNTFFVNVPFSTGGGGGGGRPPVRV